MLAAAVLSVTAGFCSVSLSSNVTAAASSARLRRTSHETEQVQYYRTGKAPGADDRSYDGTISDLPVRLQTTFEFL
jgi:hypothetical protein